MSRQRRRFVPVLASLALACLLAAGCGRPMSLEQAREVALEFHDQPMFAPTRGLGEGLRATAEEYAGVVASGNDAGPPTTSWTRDLILDFDREKLTPENAHRMRNLAEVEYLGGSLGAAILMMDVGVAKSMYKGTISEMASARALYLALAGDYKEAEAAYDLAIARARDVQSGGSPDYRKAKIRYEFMRAKAAIAFARGDMSAAEDGYRDALSGLFHYREMTSDKQASPVRGWRESELLVGLARSLLVRGDVLEAEAWARQAAARVNSLHLYRAVCFLTLAEVFFEQGRYKNSLAVSRAALGMLMERGAPRDSLYRAQAREAMASALGAMGRWGEALAQFEDLARDMAASPELLESGFGHSRAWCLALVMAGRPPEALARLDRVLAGELSGVDKYARLELEGIRALALAGLGRRDEALEAFSRVTPLLMRHWREAGVSGAVLKGRSRRLSLLMEGHLSLLARAGGHAAQAFELASAFQARSAHRSLASSAARSTAPDPALAELIRQRQDLEKRLRARQDMLAMALRRRIYLRDAQVVSEHENAVAELKQAVAVMDERIRAAFPDYATILDPGAAGLDQVRSALQPGEALVSIFSGRKETFVWAVDGRGEPVFHVVGLGRGALKGMVGRLRQSLDPQGVTTTGDVPAFDLDLAHRLYALLLQPVEAGWRDASSLLVVANSPLDRLPLAVLPTSDPGGAVPGAAVGLDLRGVRVGNGQGAVDTGDDLFAAYRRVPWLARTHAVASLPSVAALVTLRSLPPGDAGRSALAAFADPVFDPAALADAGNAAIPAMDKTMLCRRSTPMTRREHSAGLGMLPRLPETADEARAIAAAMGGDPERDVFLGPRASEARVRSMRLDDRRVLVFATHGLVRGDLDGLTEPALALSAPQVCGGPADADDDGLLRMGEILSLRLDADWVVLSACNTAAAGGQGAEAVSGLGQAFFYAGARALLVTHWPVETTSAKALTTRLFAIQAREPKLGRAEALRRAMLEVMDGPGLRDEQGRTLFTYAHPMFWAPFALVGDGR